MKCPYCNNIRIFNDKMLLQCMSCKGEPVWHYENFSVKIVAFNILLNNIEWELDYLPQSQEIKIFYYDEIPSIPDYNHLTTFYTTIIPTPQNFESIIQKCANLKAFL